VTGFVDDQLRALLRVPVAASHDRDRTEIVVWIDTAFNGGLAIPRQQIAELGLVKESSAEAILADVQSVELETFACFLDWFGISYETQIAASDAAYHLLGTLLLAGHRLNIDYEAKTVEIK
jgi:predicted aspartyl protease